MDASRSSAVLCERTNERQEGTRKEEGSNSPSISRIIDIRSILDLHRFMLRLNTSPKLLLEEILNRSLIGERILPSFSLVLRHRMSSQPVTLERVGSSSEAVQAVDLSFLESVIRSIHDEAGVAVELGGGDKGEGRIEAGGVVSSVASVAENDQIGIMIVRTNLASLKVQRVSSSSS